MKNRVIAKKNYNIDVRHKDHEKTIKNRAMAKKVATITTQDEKTMRKPQGVGWRLRELQQLHKTKRPQGVK